MKRRLVVAAVVLLLVASVAVVVRAVTGMLPFDEKSGCTVSGTSYEFSTEQAANAATIAAVGVRRGLPERAVVIALATALQESKLVNLDSGDRDSLGLFQQRPSQGWGQPTQIMDPRYAAAKFYESLVRVRAWDTRPLTDAAQAVQRSGFPGEYAKWENRANALAHALVGAQAGGLRCEFPAGGSARFGSGGRPGTADVVSELGKDFPGSRRIGGAGTTVELTPATWTTASWLMANAERLGMESVSFSGRTWTRARGGDGWRADAKAPSDRVRVGLTGAA